MHLVSLLNALINLSMVLVAFVLWVRTVQEDPLSLVTVHLVAIVRLLA